LPSGRYTDYDGLAWVYNRDVGDWFLLAALTAIEKLALPRVPSKAVVLDLCCGTGQLAGLLMERGYRVTGIDGSAEMLRYARENAPSASFILDDARTFKLPARFHLVVSVFDSLNHILNLRELAAVFANVYAVLLPGGFFLFDLITEKGLLETWNGYFNVVEDDHVYINRNSYNLEERTGKFEATIFRLENAWKRSDIVLTEKIYSETEIREALGLAEFKDITVYDSDTGPDYKPLTAESQRAFFVCRKPGKAESSVQEK
jgi:SAM-dependent methyltransferase